MKSEISRRRRRRGVSLMEVLISIFVLSVGVLGLAALIPVGRYAMMQTGKADRAGACGRAGLRDVKARQMLDAYPLRTQPTTPQWVDSSNNDATSTALAAGAFAIDPLGLVYAKKNSATPPAPDKLAGTIPRINLAYIVISGNNTTDAQRYFLWRDDQIYTMPADSAVRPIGYADSAAMPDAMAFNGHYSWFVTVVPCASELNAVSSYGVPVSEVKTFTVSVVVCYRRNWNIDQAQGRLGEQAVQVTFLGGALPVSPGGGTVQFASAVEVKENDWIMLVGPTPKLSGGQFPVGQCKWYRVAAAGESPTTYATLAGPDWNFKFSGNMTATAVIIDSVVGVYTTTVAIDRDPLWAK